MCDWIGEYSFSGLGGVKLAIGNLQDCQICLSECMQLMKKHEAAYVTQRNGWHLTLNQLRKQVIKIPVALVDY